MSNRTQPPKPGFLHRQINRLIKSDGRRKRGALPAYIGVPFTRYEVAAWSMAIEDPLRDLRITIRDRETGDWLATIKSGDYADQRRVSRHFRPFGINLQKILCRGHATA
jgi:hypothetical protein